MVQPDRKEGLVFLWRDRLFVVGVNAPEHHSHIQRQRKGETAENEILHFSYWRPILQNHFVRSKKVINERDSEVNQLHALQLQKR